MRIRMVVVLPAPLGPRKPTTSPLGTSKETSSTATVGPNRLVRFRTSIMLPLSPVGFSACRPAGPGGARTGILGSGDRGGQPTCAAPATPGPRHGRRTSTRWSTQCRALGPARIPVTPMRPPRHQRGGRVPGTGAYTQTSPTGFPGLAPGIAGPPP